MSTSLRSDVNHPRPAVVHIVGSLDGGGAERFVRELMPRLEARGLRTEVVCSYDPRIDDDGLRALRSPVHHRTKRGGFDPAHFSWLIGLLRRLQPAIVNTHQWTGKYEGRLAAIAAGVPTIVHTEHSSLPLKRIERLMAEVLWRRTDALVTFAQPIVDLVRAREPVNRVELIPNGVVIPRKTSPEDRARARQRVGASPETILFCSVASLGQNKNHELALEALARIPRDELPAVRLDIFGQGELRDQLVHRARELGVEDRAVFRGFRTDVRDLLPAYDIFLTVSKRELAPISMLEAMARALPIIGTPHQGTLEMVQPGLSGAIVDWDAAAVAAAMRSARDGPEWRSRCGAMGRARAMKDYDIENSADRYVDLYDRLLAARSARDRARG